MRDCKMIKRARHASNAVFYLVLLKALDAGSALRPHCAQLPSSWRFASARKALADTPEAAPLFTAAGLSVKGQSETRVKPNQDDFWICQDLAEGVLCVGVLDGHGKKGHDVAQDLAARLPREIAHELRRLEATGRERDAAWAAEALAAAVPIAQAGVLGNKEVLSGTSGSTMVACLVLEESRTLVLGNVGDSRAILGLRADSGKWRGSPLSQEHTTCRPEERQRIDAAQSRVDGDGNVWFGPVGIAMTRALGDGVMKGAGVICDPEFTVAQGLGLPSGGERAAFALLASDGVWDVMANDEAASIVGASLDAATSPAEGAGWALETLVHECRARWQAGLSLEQDIDDATAVLVLFA